MSSLGITDGRAICAQVLVLHVCATGVRDMQEDVPNPPYDFSTKIEEGVPCYFPACRRRAKLYYKWVQLCEHVRKLHVPMTHPTVYQSHMYAQARLEFNKQRTDRRHKNVDNETAARDPVDDVSSRDAETPQMRQPDSEPLRPGGGGPELSKRDERNQWFQKMVWVECNEHGMAVLPLNCMMVGPVPAEMAAPEADMSTRQGASQDASQSSLHSCPDDIIRDIQVLICEWALSWKFEEDFGPGKKCAWPRKQQVDSPIIQGFETFLVMREKKREATLALTARQRPPIVSKSSGCLGCLSTIENVLTNGGGWNCSLHSGRHRRSRR